jgi:putative transposase
VKEKCVSTLILLGEAALRRVLKEYVEHFHAERIIKARDTFLLVAAPVAHGSATWRVECRNRLGGLLRYGPHDSF